MQKLFQLPMGQEVKVGDRIHTKYWRDVKVTAINYPFEENPSGWVVIQFDSLHTMRTTPSTIQCEWRGGPEVKVKTKTIFMVSIPVVMELSSKDEIQGILQEFLASARHDSIVSYFIEAGVINTGLTKEEFFK